jgi:uncharacterized membrane protein YsdA (DUF1294 family)/cold shock CspA family protein
MPSMKKHGTVAKWDDARGFGFIRSAGSSGDVFFHVRDFRGAGSGVPRQGLAVTFEEIHVGGKGPRAMAVQPAGKVAAARGDNVRPRSPPPARTRSQRSEPAPASGAALALPLMAVYAYVVVSAVWTHRLPWWVIPALAALNLLTFLVYWHDKYAASQGAWRISEGTLHIWCLAGGWPGAWFAQQLLRHKSRKQAFQAAYWGTVVLHCAALGSWFFYWR